MTTACRLDGHVVGHGTVTVLVDGPSVRGHIICLPIGKPDETALAKMLQLSGGIQLDPNAPGTAAALAELTKPLISSRSMSSYRLRYPASSSCMAAPRSTGRRIPRAHRSPVAFG
jgi:hypothetical protein